MRGSETEQLFEIIENITGRSETFNVARVKPAVYASKSKAFERKNRLILS